MRAAAIAFLGGILVVARCSTLPSHDWALLLLPALALALWHPRWLIVVFFIGGFAWAGWRADRVLQDTLPPALEGRDVVVAGVIAGLPEPTEYGARFDFDVNDARVGGVSASVPRHIRLSIQHQPPVRAGETWRFTVRLKRPHGLQNPGGFDYEGYLFRKGLRATGYVRAEPAPIRLASGAEDYSIDRFRQWLGERMRAAMPENAYAGIIVALVNGDSGGITDEQWETLRRTGTLHLVAISGLHISLIAGVFYWLSRRLWSLAGVTVRRMPAQFAGAIGGLTAAVMYAALAGFVVPTQRALIMLGVAMGAVLARRRVPPSRLLAAALLLVLAFDPFAVMAPGFWLSYAAVAVIVYIVHAERGERTLWRRIGYLQFAIALGMLPLTLWLFHRASLVAPIANAAAVPLFDLLMVPSALFGALCTALGLDGIAAIVFHIDAVLLGWLWIALTFLGSLDFAQWVQHQPPAWTFVCGVIGAAVLLAPRGWPGRGVGLVWLLPMFLVRPPAPGAGEVWFTLLDVGQGLAAVVRTQRHVLVFDTGARWSARSDAGRSVVVPYLRANGVGRIDTLLVSHGDNDHAGGAVSIEHMLPVTRVLSGTRKVPGDACRAGQRWRWDDVDFLVLNPGDGADKRNDASCVVRVRGAYGVILLPADIEAGAERRLLRYAPDALRADVLVAPHHGSRTSSSAEFVDAVHPHYVVFPIGYRNRYHHPHPTVVARYRTRGSRLYDSAANGAVEFRLGADGIHVSTYRLRHHRFWYTPPP